MFNRKPFLPFHWLNVKTFRKDSKRVSKNPFMERFRFVSVSFSVRFRYVFVDKKKKKKKNAATTVIPAYKFKIWNTWIMKNKPSWARTSFKVPIIVLHTNSNIYQFRFVHFKYFTVNTFYLRNCTYKVQSDNDDTECSMCHNVFYCYEICYLRG